MKSLIIVLGILLSLFTAGGLFQKPTSCLKPADFSFVSMDTKNEGFEILTSVIILPNTEIRFCDSEWNGNHFGADESDLVWNTGEETILPGSLIQFTQLHNTPKVSYGSISNTIRISKEKDAIFAYQGNPRLPKVFIAAIANHESAYGTLINTGLAESFSALTLLDEAHTGSNIQINSSKNNY